MNIINKFNEKAHNLNAAKPVTIAFLGDSVTQGCFELYKTSETGFNTIYDPEYAYHAYLRKILNKLYPNVPLNIINAGIAGQSAIQGHQRLERDVLRFSPDLCVVCFGLNDCGGTSEGAIDTYEKSMRSIFTDLKNAGVEVILLTPNMMCTEVSCHITDELIRNTARASAERQNSGVLERYLEKARAVACELNIPICDCYAKWKCLYENGVDINNLLSNYINHPTREMNYMFALALLETMFKS